MNFDIGIRFNVQALFGGGRYSGGVDYLSLLMKYWEKNVICIKDGIHFCNDDDNIHPLPTFVEYWKDGDTKWLNLYFECCDKAKTAPTRIFFEKALKLCDTPQKTQFLKPIVLENFGKYYPDDHKD